MQNKPNLLDAQMNVTKVLTRDYENKRLCRRRKNKPNSKPIYAIGNKANLLDARMNVSSVKTTNYEQITMNNANKNKPNSKPIFPPHAAKQTQYEPKQTQPVVSLSNLFQRQKNAAAFND